jgi:hypothetical protein
MVIGFYPFGFDITKCPFLLSVKNLSGDWDRRQGHRARLVPSNRASNESGGGKQRRSLRGLTPAIEPFA